MVRRGRRKSRKMKWKQSGRKKTAKGAETIEDNRREGERREKRRRKKGDYRFFMIWKMYKEIGTATYSITVLLGNELIMLVIGFYSGSYLAWGRCTMQSVACESMWFIDYTAT